MSTSRKWLSDSTKCAQPQLHLDLHLCSPLNLLPCEVKAKEFSFSVQGLYYLNL